MNTQNDPNSDHVPGTPQGTPGGTPPEKKQENERESVGEREPYPLQGTPTSDDAAPIGPTVGAPGHAGARAYANRGPDCYTDDEWQTAVDYRSGVSVDVARGKEVGRGALSHAPQKPSLRWLPSFPRKPTGWEAGKQREGKSAKRVAVDMRMLWWLVPPTTGYACMTWKSCVLVWGLDEDVVEGLCVRTWEGYVRRWADDPPTMTRVKRWSYDRFSRCMTQAFLDDLAWDKRLQRLTWPSPARVVDRVQMLGRMIACRAKMERGV